MNASSIQFLSGFEARPEVSHVVFDFDGTLSLLRQGWPRTMLGLFLDLLTPLENEDRAALEAELVTEILSFNGKQPIHQMRAFAARVAARGGETESPEEYLATYAKRLRAEINERLDAIHSGRKDRDEFILHGGRALLERLREQGFTLFLLSGTNEDFVREEAELLGLTEFFHAGLFGGTKDPRDFSKERVYDRIISEHGITGANLLSIGDGPVEMRATVERGGLAVAVASDELNNGSGVIDPDKRAVLTAAGARVVIPDYRDADELLSCIAGCRSANILSTA